MDADDGVPRPQLLNCAYPECGATFTRQWCLQEHQTVHTGARPHRCEFPGCGRSFTRNSHLRRHGLVHSGVKNFKCTVADCGQNFYTADKLRRHQRYKHDQMSNYFKCTHNQCSETFRKRRAFKLHLSTHGTPSFRCWRASCGMRFDSHIARKAHERRHTGYRCPHPDCKTTMYSWGSLLKHKLSHPASYSCAACQKIFAKRDSLRRHKRTHSLQKPVLLCPIKDCQAYFSTTFNLQHHIRKVHLQVLSHCCSFPGCPKTFSMRESLMRHMMTHEPDVANYKLPHKRRNRVWQKRLEGRNRCPLIEDFRALFSLRMHISQKAKVEADLNGLFNERKIRHYVDPEVNLKDLFRMTQMTN